MIRFEEYVGILPEIVLTVFGILIMLAEPLMSARSSRRPLGILALVGTVVALLATCYQMNYYGTGFFGMVRVDSFSVFFHFTVIAVSAVVILFSLDYLETQNLKVGEYYGLILMGTVGMALMSSAMELVMLFIALEISSIATYILAGIRRRVAVGAESAIKYFLLGSFATAFFLYGVALIFGATGSTNVSAISNLLRAGEISSLTYMAFVMMFVGMAFKIASAPFHVWTPDVYEGAPAPIVALMSTGPKAAAFALMLRVLFGSFFEISAWWLPLVWISAALSMTIGNIGALLQNNVKRMLAYSSIAHAGYLLVAFASRHEEGVAASIFYAASYAAMNVGAFAVVSHFAGKDERLISIEDYAGLGRRSPVLAATLTIFMLSLIGIPLTGGFLAKFYIFSAALKSNLVWLVIIGLANSAIAAYYYLRLIVVMYMKEGTDDEPLVPVPVAVAAALLLTAGATLYLGIWPTDVLNMATRGAQDLLR